jgi:hypothetical protein
MKLCKDCKHYHHTDGVDLVFTYIPPSSTCGHPELVEPVHGGGVDCRAQRTGVTTNRRCGEDGYFFAAKE